MESQPENGETQLSVEQNNLNELERQKSTIETEDHRGFGDAARLIQFRGEMEALEGEIRRHKQRANEKHGG
jgi:transcription elongation GreA/GreB family factor